MVDIEKYRDEVASMSFETAMAELERLVAELEQGGADLDRSLEIYETAVVLRDHCRSILDDGQRRIQKLIEAADGLRTVDLDRERDPTEGFRSPPPMPRCRGTGRCPRSPHR